MVNIKEGNFNLSRYNISFSQSSVHTIWKFELIGKDNAISLRAS